MSISAEKVLKIVDKMQSHKSNWQSLWDDCIRLCDPTRKTSGERYTDGGDQPAPVNGTGVRACSALAGNLYANGCAQGQEWFALDINLPEKEVTDALKRWALDSTKTILRYLSAGDFYTYAQEATRSLCVLGTSIGFVEFKNGNLVFKNFNVNSDVFMQANDDGVIDTLARKFKVSAKVAIQMFGEKNVSDRIRTAFSGNREEDFEFVQFVYPRKLYGEQIDQKRKDNKNMPFGSVFVDTKEKTIVKTEGFKNFPFVCSRFYTTEGEVYGRAPSMIAMEDLKTLQRITDTLVSHASYNSNPAIVIDDRAEDFSTEEGAINRIAGLTNGMVQKVDLGDDISINNDTMKMFEDAVRETFFYSQFMALEGQQYMTAKEVEARELQKAQSIAPVVSSYQSEFLGKTIMLVYGLLRKNKIIPEPPSKIKDESVCVSYTSRLNNFLKMVGVANLMTALSQAGSIFELFGKYPDTSMYFNLSKILSLIALGNNVDTSVFFSEQETNRMIADRNEREERMAQQQALMDKIKSLDPLKTPQAGSLYSDMQKQFG